MVDFTDIHSYLPWGTARQREAYDVLCRHRIMERLGCFEPLLAGTIPIGIYMESSDLDVICRYRHREAFATLMRLYFGEYDGFGCREQGSAVVASFRADGFEVEVYGDVLPSRSQNAWRHMLIEHALLWHHGEEFRRRIVALKASGVKTEPAFARLLGIEGDPYAGLLEYGAAWLP